MSFDYFKSNVVPIVTFTAASIVLLTKILSLLLSEFSFRPEIFLAINYAIHLFLVIAVIVNGFEYSFDLNLLYEKNDNNIHKKIFFTRSKTALKNITNKAYESLNEVLKIWVRICMVWGIYYFSAMVFQLFDLPIINDNILGRLFFNSLNTLETGLAIGCYYVLNNKLEQGKTIRYTYPVRLWWTALFCIFLTDTIFKICSYLYAWEDYSYILDVVGGLLSCAFFSLIFSKINSKFLNYKSWMIITLFFYASVQAIFPILSVFEAVLGHEGISAEATELFRDMFNNVKLIGYYLALIAKGILFMLIYSEKNKHKFFVYFMLIHSQCSYYNDLQTYFYSLKR